MPRFRSTRLARCASEETMETAHGLRIPRTLEQLDPRNDVALLVYDMQVGIVSQVRGGPQIVERCREVLALARECGMRVIFSRHMSLPRELMGAMQFRTAMAWQRVDKPDQVKPWFLRDAPAFAIVPELAPLESEAIFDKITMSAFEGTPLTITLRDCGVRAVAIIGLAIEVGIEPTCRHAADLGIIPILLQDACGGGHEDAVQRSLAALEFSGDTILTDIAAFRDAMHRT
jgi:biuret amidohydrolase